MYISQYHASIGARPPGKSYCIETFGPCCMQFCKNTRVSARIFWFWLRQIHTDTHACTACVYLKNCIQHGPNVPMLQLFLHTQIHIHVDLYVSTYDLVHVTEYLTTQEPTCLLDQAVCCTKAGLELLGHRLCCLEWRTTWDGGKQAYMCACMPCNPGEGCG